MGPAQSELSVEGATVKGWKNPQLALKLDDAKQVNELNFVHVLYVFIDKLGEYSASQGSYGD